MKEEQNDQRDVSPSQLPDYAPYDSFIVESGGVQCGGDLFSITSVLESIESSKEILSTVGVAAITGIIGNASYDALMNTVYLRWRRNPEQSTSLTTDEALTFAKAAYRASLQAQVATNVPPTILGGAEVEADGSWRFEVHEQVTICEIILPPGYPMEGRITVKRTKI